MFQSETFQLSQVKHLGVEGGPHCYTVRCDCAFTHGDVHTFTTQTHHSNGGLF